MLLKKKQFGLSLLQQAAAQHMDEMDNDDDKYDEDAYEELRLTLEADITNFADTIPVNDLDLYFYLLVYATKPLYSSCATLFDKFDIANNEAWDRGEFDNFMVRAPVTVPEAVQRQMWDFLKSHGSGHHGLIIDDKDKQGNKGGGQSSS